MANANLKPQQVSVLPTKPDRRDNPFRATFDAAEDAARQFDEMKTQLAEYRAALAVEQSDHSSTRGLHKQDVERLETDLSHVQFKLDFLLEEHATLERRCEFFRRKAEMLTGKLQLLSTAAAASYQQAMEELYDEQTASKVPLPEDEAALAKIDETELADVVSRIATLNGEPQ